MNKNIVIGALVAVVLLIGIVWYASANPGLLSTTATTTPTGLAPGQTPPSNTTTPRQATAPLAVTDSTATPSGTTAVLSGEVTPNGALTTYWYEYGTSSALGKSSAKHTLGSGFAAITAPGYITGLTKNTTYSYRLVAENTLGKVQGTTYTFKTTDGTPAPVGGLPSSSTLAAKAITGSAATLNGTVSPNKATTRYWFEYGQTANLGNTTALTSVGDGSAAVSASTELANLSSGTTYFFRLNAQNKFGTVNGTILTFKTTGPVTQAPTAVTKPATDIATASATLHGTVNSRGLETMYWFEYSTDSLLGSVLLTSTAKVSAGAGTEAVAVSASVSGLTEKITYYARLVAQNDLGTVRADKVTFKTK